jgi:hypothetical protein
MPGRSASSSRVRGSVPPARSRAAVEVATSRSPAMTAAFSSSHPFSLSCVRLVVHLSSVRGLFQPS